MRADYKTIRKESDRMKERKDCAVTAVTAISNLPYAYVHRVFEECGRKRCHGTRFDITKKVLRKLNIWIDRTKEFEARTIVSLARELPRKGRFLIQTRGHILAAVDGEIMDWTKGRRHRIRKIHKVSF